MIKRSLYVLLLTVLMGCGGAKDALNNAIDVVTVDRKPIDVSKMGVNAFANDPRFGTMSEQFSEVRDTLKLGFVRVLFLWSDGVQPTPDAAPDFSFDDALLRAVPSGIDVLAVIGGLPSWMSNSANWIDGDPRKTFVERFVRPLAIHFAGNRKLSAIEVWNEPNMLANPDNTTLGIQADPAKFTQMVSMASAVIRSAAPGKRVLNGATTSINQNYPETVNYNQGMIEAGIANAIDIYAAHYYGEQFEKVVVKGGVADFLNSVGMPVWITESGAQGVNNQRTYVERAWPFLSDKIPAIARFYYYQFTEDTSPDVTYGLKNLSSTFPVSDLYVYLRDR